MGERPKLDPMKSDIVAAPVNAALAGQIALTVVAAVMFAWFSFSAEHFFELSNIINVARQVAFTTIVGVGMTLLFISGEFDLSVGSNYAFCTIVLGWLIVAREVHPWVAALIVVGIACLIGVINGVITTVVGVPSFIATLGMLSLLKGGALVISGGFPFSYPKELESSFLSITAGSVGQIPAQVWWMLAALVIGILILRYTLFGYHIFATGGNRDAARASGINTRRVKIYCFVITAGLVGVISVLQGGWLRTASPTTGTGFELEVIGAVILGGVALFGGEGSVYGTFVGAFILGMMRNGIVLSGVNANWTRVAIGAIIIIAATLDVTLRREGKLASMLGSTSESLRRRRRRGDYSQS
ncbi:MAG: ABC transporter permease [Actinomycetia bacterium]|nr:ABC transporter permease [Actinomycetes bacterium]